MRDINDPELCATCRANADYSILYHPIDSCNQGHHNMQLMCQGCAVKMSQSINDIIEFKWSRYLQSKGDDKKPKCTTCGLVVSYIHNVILDINSIVSTSNEHK